MATGNQHTAQHAYDPANFYVWPAPGGFAVHLSLQVVREMGVQIAAPGEIRGILLGRSITSPFAATMVESFVVVPMSEDFASARRGAEGAAGELRVVGYFRSQREGRLRLGPRDLQTFDRLFSDNGSIGLLVRAPRRGDSEAALYYWQDGQPEPREFGFGFPFDAVKLAGGHPGWRFPDPLEQEEADLAQETLRWAAPPVVPPVESIRWSRLLPTGVLVVAGIVATQMIWNSRGTTSANSTTAVESSVPVAAAPVYESALGLKVNSQPHQLEIRWNRAAQVVETASKATMSITEAGVTEAVPFDAQELREGYVAYTPKTNDVAIRFEVTAGDGAVTTESIRVVAIP